MNQINLAGQTAIVTGGARGIGAAVASRLRLSGARVAIWDIEQADTPSPESDDQFTANVDITDPSSVKRAADEVLARWNSIDILVNSAGIAGPTCVTWDYPLEQWRRVQAVNVEGTLICCQHVLPSMIERNYGRIVNIASIAGKEGNPKASAYSASKAAVIALTKSLGKELARHDIAVNCVTPVTARTRILEQVTQEFIEYMLAKIPRGRFVTVEEIAAMIAWLCSRENSFATGAVFDLSGGRATY
ncbi:MAG: SDR family oxidoreductase [Gammaproteobacteria bacterium]|nr:SDR family oxidoreductase [Gammaproteobacteria bacterium]